MSRIKRHAAVAAIAGGMLIAGGSIAYGYEISPFFTSDNEMDLSGCHVVGDFNTYWINAYEAYGDCSNSVGTRGVFQGVELSIVWGATSKLQAYPNYELTLDKYKLYHY